MVYSTNEEIEFSAFGQEIVNLAKSSNLVYRFAKTDVFRTGALELFDAGTSPFITMARNKMTKENILTDKEKALKALDMLEKHIMNCDLHNKVNFKFPKDDEVEE